MDIKKKRKTEFWNLGLISKANPIEPKTESDTKSVHVQVTHPKSQNKEQPCRRERDRGSSEWRKTKFQLGVGAFFCLWREIGEILEQNEEVKGRGAGVFLMCEVKRRRGWEGFIREQKKILKSLFWGEREYVEVSWLVGSVWDPHGFVSFFVSFRRFHSNSPLPLSLPLSLSLSLSLYLSSVAKSERLRGHKCKAGLRI
jgi:hypothetical protein